MTHWRKLRDEKYLGSWDFELNKEYPFLIDRVEKEEIASNQGGKNTRPVLYTKAGKKGLVINVVNGKMIECLHGKEIEQWVGKYVIIVARPEYQKMLKETIDVIRILNKHHQVKP